MPLREPRWRHPELQPGWIDRPHQTLALGELQLESGEAIRDFEISYVAHGTRARSDGAIGRQMRAMLLQPIRRRSSPRFVVRSVNS